MALVLDGFPDVFVQPVLTKASTVNTPICKGFIIQLTSYFFQTLVYRPGRPEVQEGMALPHPDRDLAQMMVLFLLSNTFNWAIIVCRWEITGK